MMEISGSRVVREVLSLLYWSMLAACTVGPGTVVTCARAGAEFQLSLIYVLMFASAMAFILQEGSARLTISSGLSLGQCLRRKYRASFSVWGAAWICWLVAACVVVGNTFYECNDFAGAIDAIKTFPGVNDLDSSSLTGVRIGGCFVHAFVTLALLYKDKTDTIGVFLGVILMGMVMLFLTVVSIMGVNWENLAWGLIPNFPAKEEQGVEPADIIISLVGTTSYGLMLFLGGAMAKGQTLPAAQRGIAFSTVSALMVSVLIMVVGAGYHKERTLYYFSITHLGPFIQSIIGTGGVVIFSVGFVAASFSSMLTVPLGATLTLDSLFVDEKAESSGENREAGSDEQQRKLPKWITFGMMTAMVLISMVVIQTDVDRTAVVLVAQVFNGCLLPFFSTLLLICLNDPQFMGHSPQPLWNNILLVISVIITMFLANNSIVQKIFGGLLAKTSKPTSIRLLISLLVAFLEMVLVLVTTSLGKDLLNSLKKVGHSPRRFNKEENAVNAVNLENI